MTKISLFRKFMKQPTLIILCELWVSFVYFIGLVLFFKPTIVVTLFVLTIFSISVLIVYAVDAKDFSEFLSHNSFLDIFK